MSDNGNEDHLMCPSAKCDDGAILLGVVQKNGHIAFLSEKLTVNNEFIQIAHKGRMPEKRFRFANTCVMSGCKQWTGKRCSVIDEVIKVILDTVEEPNEIPDCSIRSQCRWYSQCGAKACAVCPEVVTDLNVA
ncbi:MAG: hypothetical protein HZA84_01195 [Thaumarchaeota archaeon]|nr:hypothetical protein [Nitrososphaerota archaeon]